MASKTCDRLRPYLVDFVVGELSSADVKAEDIERHLAECPACRSVAEELRGTGRALEAVRSFDTRMREEVRRNLTSRARVEAQLVRATREHQRIAGMEPGRPVPLRAWVALALGLAAAAALALVLPRLLRPKPVSAAEVVATSGEAARGQWPKGTRLESGQSLAVPAGCLVRLLLLDGTGLRLDLAGLSEVRAPGPDRPLELVKGQAYFEASGNVAVKVEQLDALRLAGGCKACLVCDPSKETPVLLTVLAGSAEYRAAGKDGSVAQGNTLEVSARGRGAAVRPMREPERPLWRGPLDAE